MNFKILFNLILKTIIIAILLFACWIFIYIQSVYGYEIVLDSNKNIVTDPLNMGTYNFYNPTLDGVEPDPLLNGNTKHFLYDVLPYYKFGNSPNDPTNGSDRILRNLNILFIK